MFESTTEVSNPELPARYEAVRRLGQGGGGEVWAVRDRAGGGIFALKVLAEDASDREMAALVREAAALSGLEGLGVPRVQGFGRLPRTGRAFMLRELVEGTSLDVWTARGASLESGLRALASASDQLTVLHRAGLLHGDVKPANVIVQADGSATFVDLGLAAPFREGGSQAEGLSPRYAAPELFEGKPLTARAEVYALGVTLQELLETRDHSVSESARRELSRVAGVATSPNPTLRHPSADEFASALRRAIGLAPNADESADTAALWPVVGIDAISATISKAADALADSGLLVLTGGAGSGRTALLRRLSWSLGARGEPVVLFDAKPSASAVDRELSQYPHLGGVFVLIDDADEFDAATLERLREARRTGARLVAVGVAELGAVDREIEVPALDTHAARDLVRRAVPSLGDALLTRIVELSEGRPGELQRIVRLIAKEPLASIADVERLVDRAEPSVELPSDPLERALVLLARGRYNDAAAALDELPADVGERAAAVAIARARLDLGLGDAEAAHRKLAPFVDDPSALRDDLLLYWGRAKLGTCDYAGALEILGGLAERESPLGAEAKAFHGLALSLVGRQGEAQQAVQRAVERARALGDARTEAVTLASQGLVEQRADRMDEARSAYEAAITASERANDVGTLALVRANLAGLLKVRGDIAGAIEQFEAALDMGRRSGRRQTARQALLNLANLDVYLGRVARARARIEALEEQRAQLPQIMRAQITGVSAELLLKEGNIERAVKEYEASAREYEALGLTVDASEARLEAVLAGVRGSEPDTHELRRCFELGRTGLGDTKAHRPLLLVAAAGLANTVGDEVEARARLDEALVAAREAQQREWLWRALAARAELEESGGQPLLAKRDREEAVAVLEEIGARLPRDLREVYWNDARRSELRSSVANSLASATTEFSSFSNGALPDRTGNASLSRTTNLSQLSTTPLERRLSRLLEVNAELATEHDLERLTARITDYAVELARAERGLVLLRNPDGTLSIKSSRARGADQPDAEFSRSIAEEVMNSHKPVVALNARSDARMANYRSVHQLSVESVACVPVLSPEGQGIGALYVETRARKGSHFEKELPALRAFADQVAIALENTRLIEENLRRTGELERANQQLSEAQERLQELLGDRTEQLKRARRRLKDARETLYGHFGYHGLVGTSAAMRRVYALIERVKDTDVPVLITGESGTGKEMVARAIHETSARAKAKMLGVNCGAIPENLLESELFGHVRGAFTGADRERRGLFRECDGGTILLDEIGETPLKMQAGLLRVLQERTVRPVGGSQEQAVDVRVICATNRELQTMAREGKFREDLYYRIHVVEVRLPALRERAEDVPQLVDHFLGIFSARYKREKKAVSREALRMLADHDWPGNVRQLENVLLNAWVMSEEDELVPEDFDLPELTGPRLMAAPEPTPAAAGQRRAGSKGTTSEHFRGERERILEALRSCNWNRVKAAELTGIPRRTFYRRLREYGIQ